MKRKRQLDAPQPYLDSDFGKELNFQLWATKGSRFHGARRLEAKHRWSNYAIVALAMYVFAINLMPIFQLPVGIPFSDNSVRLATVLMSIFLLIITQIESSKQYNLRAKELHDCALEIGELYRELRRIRTCNGSGSSEKRIKEIAVSYGQILRQCSNHEQIEFLYFQTTKNEYFKIGLIERLRILLLSYLKTWFFYHVAIVLPPTVYLLIRL